MKENNKKLKNYILIPSNKHPKCKSYQCNHPLDPVEYDCEYKTKIDCDECKYSQWGGRKDPEAKCNILK